MATRSVAILVGALMLTACEGRPRHSRVESDGDIATSRLESHVAEIDLRGSAPERASGSLFTDSSGRSFADLVLQLRTLAQEPNAKGVFLRLASGGFNMARAEELGRLLGEVRAKKVPVVCHADGYTNATLLAASLGCSEIWLSPAGSVESIGVAAQLVFARELFEKIGVRADFMQEGRFKGAEEPFTRNEPSPEARQSLESTLRAIRGAWIEGIERGRSQSADALGIEDGPHSAADAKDRKLIDRIGFDSEARERALELAGVRKRWSYFGDGRAESVGVGGLLRALTGTPEVSVPHIAVVRATGAITLSGSSLFASDGIAQRELAPVLRRLARAPLTKAVVLRIDSPGGSALASDLLWREVMELKKNKPVVASVGGMAASGGYYIACAAHKIVAEQSSILGSIGVVMGKFAVDDALAKYGVHVTIVPAKAGAGARAAYGSALVPWDDATRAKLSRSMKQTYQLFVERVAEARGMAVADITPAAEGRIMGGADAKALGLADEIGGLTRAIQLAAELAKIDAATPVHVQSPPSSLLEILGDAELGERRRALVERQRRDHALQLLFGPVATGMLRDELLAFAALLGPIAEGEHVLAAAPFALSIK